MTLTFMSVIEGLALGFVYLVLVYLTSLWWYKGREDAMARSFKRIANTVREIKEKEAK